MKQALNQIQLPVQLQQQNSLTTNENDDLLNNHTTNNYNNRGINMKPKEQAIKCNWFQKIAPLGKIQRLYKQDFDPSGYY